MKKKLPIPVFKSIPEEAEFWDTHDITDFEDETEEVEIVFDLKQPKDETLVVRLQKNVKEQLKQLARKKGLDASSLARMWLMEKMQLQKAKLDRRLVDGVADKGKDSYKVKS